MIKKMLSNIPMNVGVGLNGTPFFLRLGPKYITYKESIKSVELKSAAERKKNIFNKVKNIVFYAYNNVEFYKYFYDKNNFNLNVLKKYSDIVKIPVITKADLKEFSIEERSSQKRFKRLSNTGGTSGSPLDFFLDYSSYPREWAHMHYIWEHFDYRPSQLKLTFRGVNIGELPFKYNFTQNEILINHYCSKDILVKKLTSIVQNNEIKYLHGYPSAIYDFSRYVNDNAPEFVVDLKKHLKGIFLGSEYPAPAQREFLEQLWGVPSISWYGHSEMCVLAFEKNKKYEYEPMLTYGLAEAIEGTDGYSLITTAYDNYSTPFIRYDCGDSIEPLEVENGILRSFKISGGRRSEFVVDKNGQRISLTALIFGRHHPLFNVAKFVQICQKKPGEATIVVTKDLNNSNRIDDINRLFDSSNVSIDFNFLTVDQPIKTKLGKVPLLVNAEEINGGLN